MLLLLLEVYVNSWLARHGSWVVHLLLRPWQLVRLPSLSCLLRQRVARRGRRHPSRHGSRLVHRLLRPRLLRLLGRHRHGCGLLAQPLLPLALLLRRRRLDTIGPSLG